LKKSTLSVLMTNYNHASFLPEALTAILNQSYRPQEIIIIDDASTDNSVEVIERFCRKYSHIKLVRNERNLGVVKNIERLLEICTGDYFYSASADDKVLPGFFEKSMRLLEQFPEAGLCSALAVVIDEYGKHLGISKVPIISLKPCFVSPQQFRLAFVKHGSWLNGLTAIFRRQAVIEVGGFIPELGPFVDAFTCEVLTLRYGVCFIPEPLVANRRMVTDYSMVTGANLERMMEIKRQSEVLMNSTYRELFPPDCQESVRWQIVQWLGLCTWNVVERKQEKFCKDVVENLRPTSSWVDHLFLLVMRLWFAAQKLTVKFFFVGRLRRSGVAWLQFWKNYCVVCLRFHSKRFRWSAPQKLDQT
jgi:glycosyltransferase involved in cell wall biosynthesis